MKITVILNLLLFLFVGCAEEDNADLFKENQLVKPYLYKDMGLAFNSSDTKLIVYDAHASWTHGNVAYDSNADNIVIFYNIKPSHTLKSNKVCLRKKLSDGRFSGIYVVANKIREGISCKTQASGIAANGDYISLVAYIENKTENILGTYIYRSSDKGISWSTSEMKINNKPVLAYNGDVSGFLVLKNGRILTLACRKEDRLLTIMYSDDNGKNWAYAKTAEEYKHTEPAWCELSDGTIICYLRETVEGNFSNKTPARFTKSTDGGLTWNKSVKSQSILDYTESNGHLISHPETKTIEFIHHSRYTQSDGYSSLYVSVATEAAAKKDIIGTQNRILNLSPQGVKIKGEIGDAGYVGACITKDGTINAFYYNGSYTKAQIYYIIGKKQ